MPYEVGRGLYRPDDMLWRVHSEVVLLLGGARSVMLEIAHPLIAAGVARHSSFRKRPFKRLLGTVRTMVLLTFGDARMAQVAAKHTNHCHAPVHGTLGEQVGATPAGAAYDAGDPALRLWVFATLIDSNLLIYDRFVRPLSMAEKSAYYEDSKRMARMLGVPVSVMPPTYCAFLDYFQAMLGGDALAVGAEGKDVMQGLFGHPLLGPAIRLVSYAGIGLLPARLREGYGYRWREVDERRLRWLASAARWLRRALPDFLCTFPASTYYAARYRDDQLY